MGRRVTTEDSVEIGPYRVLEELGSGGMGVVYLAKQTDPVERLVALKRIGQGNWSALALNRFDAERRALGRLNHPNVSQIYDVGVDESGAPYIAMEFVPGMPITQYCESNQCTVPERLELFLQLCRGVQHVHHNGLIHRDLKPENILVTETLDAPTVKIIDFGIAKGIDRPLSDEDLTRGSFLGTPIYMAPEVIRGNRVDARVDIYAMGLVLDRLLVSVSPIPADEQRNVLGMLKRLSREQIIERSSTRFAELNLGRREQIAARRQTTADRLLSQLREDLDWIVARAISFDADDRYASADTLAGDVRRYLEGEPVEARQGNRRYVLEKVVRRYRRPVAGAATLMLMLAAVAGVAFWQTAAADKATRRADDAAHAVHASRAEADRMTEFLLDVLGSPSPFYTPQSHTVDDVLDVVERRVLADSELAPLSRADLLLVIAQTHISRNALGPSRVAASEALTIRERELGPDHRSVADALSFLAAIEGQHGEAKRAVPLAERALTIYETLPGTEGARAGCRQTLSYHYRMRGDFDRAATYANDALRDAYIAFGRGHPNTARFLMDLSSVQIAQVDLAGAQQTLELGLDILEGQSGPAVHLMETALGRLHRKAGRPAEAISILDHAHRGLATTLGAHHEQTLNARHNIAIAYAVAGESDAARRILDEMLLVGGALPPNMAASVKLDLANLDLLAGEAVRAEALQREALTLLDPSDTFRVFAGAELARSLSAQGRFDAALEVATRTLEFGESMQGSQHPDVAEASLVLGRIHEQQGRALEGRDVYRAARSILERERGESSPGALLATFYLARSLSSSGAVEAAAPLFSALLKHPFPDAFVQREILLASVDFVASGGGLEVDVVERLKRHRAAHPEL